MVSRRRLRLTPDDPELGIAPYAWLIYIVFVFLGPVFMGVAAEPAPWIATVVSLPPFLGLYFWATWVQGRKRFAIGLGIAAVGVLLTPWNTGANTYFIYAAFYAGMASERVWEAAVNLGVVLVVLAGAAVFLCPSAYFWGPAAAGCVAVGVLGVDVTRRARANAQLRIARAEVETLARIAERERIGRELHDLLGQSLSVIALKADLAQRLLERDPDRVAEELVDIHSVARESLAEVREAVRGYRAGGGAGLRREVASAQRAVSAVGVELEAPETLDGLSESLDAEHEAVLALALREGITNVVRHARASRCSIRSVDDASAFGLEIVDDGRGSHGPWGSGLQGMRERVEALGGRLERIVDSGTTLRVLFPRVEVEA